MEAWFSKFAVWTAHNAGRGHTFAAALVVVLLWGALGPHFQYSDTWQLVINTGTTIITFLMVFLLQNTMNRDTLAIHLKLDELIRATKNAENRMMRLDTLTEKELLVLKDKFDEEAGEPPV